MKLFKPSWVSHDGEFFSIHNILNVGQGWANCVSYAALWRFLWTSCAQCTLLVIFYAYGVSLIYHRSLYLKNMG